MNHKQQYGRYQVIEELGRGSMGVVYRAFDPSLNRSIALKVMRPDRPTRADFVRRFSDEARAIGQLSHANIVNVYDRGEDQGILFMAMELLEGDSLKEVIETRGLSYQETVNIGVQVAEALAYAHQRGVVHRDIKPSNIIMLDTGQVKITDFGIARIEDPEATRNTQLGQIVGTPCYMSPEQVQGKTVDGRSDLFSLGVILYEITTHEKPFAAGTCAATYAAILGSNPPAPHQIDKQIPRRLSDLIMKSISKNMRVRFQDGQEMAQALKSCLQRRRSDSKEAETSLAPNYKLIALTLTIVVVMAIAAALGVKQFIVAPKEKARVAAKEKIVMTPREKANVTIESDPSDAQIYINGDLKGNTPLQIDLDLGKYEIRLSKPHYYHWEAQVNLDQKGPAPVFGNLLPMESGDSTTEE